MNIHLVHTCRGHTCMWSYYILLPTSAILPNISRVFLTMVVLSSLPPVVCNHSIYPVILPTVNIARFTHFCQLDGSKMKFHLIITVVPYPCPMIFSFIFELPRLFFFPHLPMGLFSFFHSSCSLYILDANPFFVCCNCMFLCAELSSLKLCLYYISVLYFTKAIQVILM